MGGCYCFFYIIDQIAERNRRKEREAIEQKLKKEKEAIQKLHVLIHYFCILLHQAQYQSNFYKQEDNDKLKNKSRLLSKIPEDLKGGYLDEEATVEAIFKECIKENRVYKITNESLKLIISKALKLKIDQGPLLITKKVFVICLLQFYKELFKNMAPSLWRSASSFVVAISTFYPYKLLC